MSIWFDKDVSFKDRQSVVKGTMIENVGIEWLELGEDFIKARMPVDNRTTQPYGFLHGGASCVLAETIGSFASSLVIDVSKFICVGLEINANHIRTVTGGYVYGVARPLHLGGSTHVWDIKITDEKERLICVSRLTVAVLAAKK